MKKNQKINDEAATALFEEFLDAFELDKFDKEKEDYNNFILKAIKYGRVDFDLDNYKVIVTLKHPVGDKKQVTLSLDNVTTGKAQDAAKDVQKSENYNELIELISCGGFSKHEIIKARPSDTALLAGLSLYFLNY